MLLISCLEEIELTRENDSKTSFCEISLGAISVVKGGEFCDGCVKVTESREEILGEFLSHMELGRKWVVPLSIMP